MEQRISLVTLGVADLARARAFYQGSAGARPGSPTTRSASFRPAE